MIASGQGVPPPPRDLGSLWFVLFGVTPICVVTQRHAGSELLFFFFGGGLGSVLLNLIPVFSEQKKQMCYYIKLTKVFKF